MERSKEDFVYGLVSVIIPVYNSEKYIERTLYSVFSQTYQEIEIILVDDQSTDNTADIIKKIKANHPEIVYYLEPQNMGAGIARNKALELAKGQYVAFLDADDLWRPEKIEKQVKLLKEKKGGFCFTAIEMINGNDVVVKEKRKIKEEVNYKFLLTNTMIPTSSVLIDRTIQGDFFMHLRRGGQDYATWLRLLRNGTIAYGIDEALVKYRIDGASLCSNKLKSVHQIWEIQTKEEGIFKLNVFFNILMWSWNSILKYFM